MRLNSWRHTTSFIALLAAAGLVLTACDAGGDASPTPTDGTATAVSTPTVAPSPTAGTPAASPTASDGTATPTTSATATATPAATAADTPTASATPAATASPTPTATAPPITPAAVPAAILLTPFEPTVTFERPVEVFALPGDPALYVVEQNQAVVLRLYQGSTTLALDLSDRVLVSGNEEGLLSAEPDPAFSTNGRLWVYYSTAQPRRTILSYVVQTAPGEFDAESEAVVLEIGQPFSNHNGGSIRFGPDGMLYLGVGDGGSSGDPQGNGQDASTLLGSILRIDVRSTSPARPYLVPVSNPLVGGTGVRAEVWAYGLRNPWRMDWDASTGSLWVADVGQNAIEEVSIATAGANLGWKVMEGDRCYNASTCNQTGLTMPVAVYNHQGGRCSITGGPVVRGGSVPEVEGAYLFADYCSGEVFGMRASPVGNVVRIYQGAGNVASIAQVRGEVYLLVFGKPLQRVVSP